MAQMTLMEAIRETIRSEMKKDPTLFLIGEDVGRYGGEHGVSGDLWQQFGDDRVRDAPIAEASIIEPEYRNASPGERVGQLPERPVARDEWNRFITVLRTGAGGRAGQLAL